MPNPHGVNRRKKARTSQEPRFLRKRFHGYGRVAPARILRILGWAIAIWLGSAILLGDAGLVSILQMRGMRESLHQEIETLEQTKAETIELEDSLENDPLTVERVARERYGMIRDGEIRYHVELPEEDEETE